MIMMQRYDIIQNTGTIIVFFLFLYALAMHTVRMLYHFGDFKNFNHFYLYDKCHHAAAVPVIGNTRQNPNKRETPASYCSEDASLGMSAPACG